MSPRIRLSFSHPPPAYPSHSEFMFLINDKICKTVFDVKNQIKNTFKVTREIQLEIDGFFLLDSENAKVLQHDDVVTILLNEDPQSPLIHKLSTMICDENGEKVRQIEAAFEPIVSHFATVDASSTDSDDEVHRKSVLRDGADDMFLSQSDAHETAVVPPESDSPVMVQSEVHHSVAAHQSLESEKKIVASCPSESELSAPRSLKINHIDAIKSIFMADAEHKSVKKAQSSSYPESEPSSSRQEKKESYNSHAKNKLLMTLLECDGYQSSTVEDIKEMKEFLRSGITMLTGKHKSSVSSIAPVPKKNSKLENLPMISAQNVEGSSSETIIYNV